MVNKWVIITVLHSWNCTFDARHAITKDIQRNEKQQLNKTNQGNCNEPYPNDERLFEYFFYLVSVILRMRDFFSTFSNKHSQLFYYFISKFLNGQLLFWMDRSADICVSISISILSVSFICLLICSLCALLIMLLLLRAARFGNTNAIEIRSRMSAQYWKIHNCHCCCCIL